MLKPTTYKTVYHPFWHIPCREPRFITHSAMDAALKEWAKSKNRFEVEVYLIENSEHGTIETEFDTFTRMTREVSFRHAYDDRTYEVEIHTGKFDAGIYGDYIDGYDENIGATLAQCKAGFEAWLNKQGASGLDYKFVKIQP